jgi:betaine-aldehyde dehydrogenase
LKGKGMTSQTRFGTQSLYIGGQHLAATSGKTFATFNPANGEKLADIQAASREDVDRAVSSAREGQRVWVGYTAMQRSRVLRRAV